MGDPIRNREKGSAKWPFKKATFAHRAWYWQDTGAVSESGTVTTRIGRFWLTYKC